MPGTYARVPFVSLQAAPTARAPAAPPGPAVPALTIADVSAAVRRSNTLIGSLAVQLGDADAMLCGLLGRFDAHLEHVCNVVGLAKGAPGFATLNALMLQDRTLFIADTYVNEDPSAELLAGIAAMAVEEVRRFGLPPKVAFLSHSNYGTSSRASGPRSTRRRSSPVRCLRTRRETSPASRTCSLLRTS